MNEVAISKTEGGLKMTHPYILSIDQSTQGTKAMLLDEYGSFLLRRDVPHRQIISDSGWVGHDASEIAANIFRAARLALQDAGVDPAQVAAVAVTNQRESVAVWAPSECVQRRGIKRTVRLSHESPGRVEHINFFQILRYGSVFLRKIQFHGFSFFITAGSQQTAR